MKIAYFPNHCALNSKPVMQAFLSSCRRHNITPVENSTTADAAVIWSMLWSGRMSGNQLVYQRYRQSNRPVFVIEVGALVRNVTWKIAVNNVTSQGHYGHLESLDWDRPQRLGLVLGHTQPTNPGILIAAQHQHSHTVANLPSIEHWVTQTVQQVQAVTSRPIYVRPHPRSRLNRALVPSTVEYIAPGRLPNTYDHYDLEYSYQAVINYNSGVGIQSALHGVNTVVDQSSLAYPVSVALRDIERTPALDRSQWLTEISHTEYTIDEIEQGTWFPRLKSYAFDQQH
jgi:hypothetical protein